MDGHDAISRAATLGDTYYTGTDVSAAVYFGTSLPAVPPAASPVPWRERDAGAAAAETDMRWAVARFAATPRTPTAAARNSALNSPTATTTPSRKNTAIVTATAQGARRGSPRQPAEKPGLRAAAENPRTLESLARGSPRQVADKVSPAARAGDPQPPFESPGRRATRDGASQQCGGEGRKAVARRSFDSCDALKSPALVAAGVSSPQSLRGGKEREKKGELKDNLLKKKQGFLEGASCVKGSAPVVGSSSARAKARERETKELTDNLLKEFFEGAASGIEGASPGKRRPPVVGSNARANGRRTIGSLAELRQLAITEHGRQTPGHGPQLTQHKQQLTEHGRQLTEHGRQLTEHRRQQQQQQHQ
ncbi:unnamed protein product [Closterium sp. Yama58-4]|nr:unnamed protein product [Closterium sp. Yama58-4]